MCRCGSATPRRCSRSSRRHEVSMRRYGVKRLFRFPFRTPGDVREEIAEEFRFHLDMRTEELLNSGLLPDDARAQATREFGDQQRGAHVAVMHGVMSYTVSQRRGELGVRAAVGASAASLLRLVMVDGLRMTLAGAAIGLLLAGAL